VGEEYAAHPRQDLQLSRTIAKIKIDGIYGIRASAKMPISDTEVPTEKVEAGCPVSLVTPLLTGRPFILHQAFRLRTFAEQLRRWCSITVPVLLTLYILDIPDAP
jgi:hypothetical protein